jgi:hypothetical protein
MHSWQHRSERGSSLSALVEQWFLQQMASATDMITHLILAQRSCRGYLSPKPPAPVRKVLSASSLLSGTYIHTSIHPIHYIHICCIASHTGTSDLLTSEREDEWWLFRRIARTSWLQSVSHGNVAAAKTMVLPLSTLPVVNQTGNRGYVDNESPCDSTSLSTNGKNRLSSYSAGPLVSGGSSLQWASLLDCVALMLPEAPSSPPLGGGTDMS